ncbi:MAG: xylosidase [Zunongwangia sp.]|uniref:Xylosidase n=3 Tax=Zunongwangia profunda TaxID=398743 RepID=A0A3D5J1R8_9FLAO|nr:xylosidase [Flavobacteriaceae bacterium]MAO35911.1 xylosidase [Zunongwangia sp.]HAJ80983.1 xylosidase [Zunongwangia profunda]HCV81260.1 xylosidase [Zunongwangia profunda]
MGIACIAFTFTSLAFNNDPNYEKTKLGIKLSLENANLEIQFYTSSMVRVIKTPKNSSYEKKSLSVVLEPKKTSFKIEEKKNELLLRSEKLEIAINTETGNIRYNSPDHSLLLKEKTGDPLFTPFKDVDQDTYTVSQSFNLDPKETIYGLGILQNGKMSQRNLEVKMIQANREDYIPFFQSVKGYGLFWDNYSPTRFSDDTSATSFTSEVGDGIDYYFMYGGNADSVIAHMRQLTGQAPMFPLWTYGYWQSKERYKSQEETVGVVKKYRDLGVPLDGIIQDWQYWGDNYHWNAMEFLNEEFPNPQKMVDDIHALNAHIIISIWSSFGPKTQPYKELEKDNMLFNFSTWPQSGKSDWPPNMDYPSGVRVYDPYNPKARDIYWKYLKKGLFSLGIDGWWMDSTEPDHLDITPKDFDEKTYLGSFRKVRNAFPLMTVGGVYKHMREATSDKRVFILTRSAFAGQQRYAANTWSGDTEASWKTLKDQISSGLNFSLTGIPYWNSDIGGFFIWEFKDKLDDPEYRELYARWLQFATFTPMMRSHGADAPREIYQFGKKGEPVYDALEKYINLRYSLLPYIYSEAWQITNQQSSLMRALVMDFPNDEKVLDLNDQYMFGHSFLVAPVLKSMYTEDKKENFQQDGYRQVYLPKGTEWFDYWTGERFSGGQTIDKKAPIDILPLYVKAGSIVPVGPKVDYAEQKDWSNLKINIYPGADAEFTLYEDENDNYNYEKGAYSEIKFVWDNNKQQLTIEKRQGKFEGMIKNRSFQLHKETAETTKTTKKITYKGDKMVIAF